MPNKQMQVDGGREHSTGGRRPGRVAGLASAFLCAGAFAMGAGFAGLSLVSPEARLDAGAVNYVRSSSHDAVSGVRLDEVITIRFNAAVLDSTVGPDTILIRTGVNNGEQAMGRYIVGKFMYDRSTQRRVVIRPESIQEYYQLIKGLPRADAARLTRRLITKLERKGKFGKLRKIDRDLRAFFGPSFGAGTRLDDEGVTGIYPPQLLPADALEPYRQRISGDDVLYQDHLDFIADPTEGDANAFAQLTGNSEFERFFHPINGATGVADADSVLRRRAYRQVLINRRSKARVMFVPDVPIKGSLDDVGFQIGKAYATIIPAFQPGVLNTVLTRSGHRPLRQRQGRDFSTLFTTIPGSLASTSLFLGNEARTGVAALQKPRIINVTPPNGESFVDGTTDWEDPDDARDVPIPARRTFTMRIRFAQPLDPRTVTPSTFTLTKTKTRPGTTSETVVSVPVAVGTFLSQRRLGIVEVEVTPATNLDPESEYELVVKGNVRTLGSLADGSQATLETDFRSTFIVGEGPIPLDKIKEDFVSPANRADPGDIDTLGQQTTALWPAPRLFDQDVTGKLFANFMPFLGLGTGAPRIPTNPATFDENNPETFPVTHLVLSAGQLLTLTTEGVDPGDVTTFAKQIEYEYQNVTMTTASVVVIGRFPLVLRSHGEIALTQGTQVFVQGLNGASGGANTDTAAGLPTGGLGGAPGSGGFRGGDGAFAPLTDGNGLAILDGFGNLQPDPLKFDGLDGLPSHLVTGPLKGGAGRGGYSGDQEGPTFVDMLGTPFPDASPERTREAGGGGGHGAEGGDGAGGQNNTGQTDTNGIIGGKGGPTYGQADMSDQPVNAAGVPFLGPGTGGAGGGGGGGEDDPNVLTMVEDTVGPEDAGGGGGAGGGGAVHFVARTEIRLDSSVIDCSGGIGGGTFLADGVSTGEGAPGGCGAGGTIWFQCVGDIIVSNGSTVSAAGGQGSVINNLGSLHPNNADNDVITGIGGLGGDGYVRFEDSDGVAFVSGSSVLGVVSEAAFEPTINGDYPAHPGFPMVLNTSTAYSRWFNSELDTPTYILLDDDPLTAPVEGTLVHEAPGQTVDVFARTAPGDPGRAGQPQSLLATAWTPIADVETISDRRFLQFRVDFLIPLSYLPYTVTGTTVVNPGTPEEFTVVETEQTDRSFVDCIAISVELQ